MMINGYQGHLQSPEFSEGTPEDRHAMMFSKNLIEKDSWSQIPRTGPKCDRVVTAVTSSSVSGSSLREVAGWQTGGPESDAFLRSARLFGGSWVCVRVEFLIDLWLGAARIFLF